MIVNLGPIGQLDRLVCRKKYNYWMFAMRILMNRMDNNMKIYRNDRNKLVKKSINDVILYLLEIINQKISKK